MEITLKTIKKLIKQVEPFGLTAAVLQLEGYGKLNKDKWVWNEDTLTELNEEQTLKLVNELTTWTV